ncbi:MAG: response regulator transcription factor [Saccharofermentans sp.]|nr:response regulator transcription factor [Saccharofermentans sp.]
MRYDCLIIDDEHELADNTCEYFNMFDVKTAAVYSSAEADEFLKNNEPGLVLLDINLSDGSGFELCKKIRQTLNIPILFISARNTDDDKIIALNIGGDDYIEKPYSLGVLLAKVKVVLKRFAGSAETDCSKKNDYDDGYLRTDSANKAVYVGGEEKKITSIEWKLLEYLIENKNRLVTKNEIFDKVWNDKFTTDGTLNVHIRKIREAIEKDAQDPKYIITVWKEGYKFIAPGDN